MNMSDFNAAQQQVKEISEAKGTPEQTFGPCTAASVLSFLYERTTNLDVAELAFLSRSTDVAREMSAQLAQTVNNIGALIDAESMLARTSSSRAGNFELGDNVAKLLFCIGDQANVISELCYIGDQSEFALRQKGVKNV